MEAKIQEAIFKTEEEIMGCPLLQKAMAKVEEEALNGPQEEQTAAANQSPEHQPVEKFDAVCQVWPLTHFVLFAFCRNKKTLIFLEGIENDIIFHSFM